jgi:hypothetical protein
MVHCTVLLAVPPGHTPVCNLLISTHQPLLAKLTTNFKSTLQNADEAPVRTKHSSILMQAARACSTPAVKWPAALVVLGTSQIGFVACTSAHAAFNDTWATCVYAKTLTTNQHGALR